MFLLLAILIPMATGGLLPLWKFKKSAPRAAYVFSALALISAKVSFISASVV